MLPVSTKYKSLPQEEGLKENTISFDRKTPGLFRGSKKVLSSVILLCVLFTVIFNAFLYTQYRYWAVNCVERTQYAGLTRNVSIPFTWKGPYNNDSEGLVHDAWEALNIDRGIVAFTDTYVKEMGLPTSQRFPWDDKKGLYNVNGFHQLHCLKLLHVSLIESKNGLEQSTPFDHHFHCLDALRQEVICNADDTPRYSGFQPSKSSGLGQFRQCRDWKALEAWADRNTACYRYINHTQPDFDTLERYKFCPEGSPYNSWIHEVFGDFES